MPVGLKADFRLQAAPSGMVLTETEVVTTPAKCSQAEFRTGLKTGIVAQKWLSKIIFPEGNQELVASNIS